MSASLNQLEKAQDKIHSLDKIKEKLFIFKFLHDPTIDVATFLKKFLENNKAFTQWQVETKKHMTNEQTNLLKPLHEEMRLSASICKYIDLYSMVIEVMLQRQKRKEEIKRKQAKELAESRLQLKEAAKQKNLEHSLQEIEPIASTEGVIEKIETIVAKTVEVQNIIPFKMPLTEKQTRIKQLQESHKWLRDYQYKICDESRAKFYKSSMKNLLENVMSAHEETLCWIQNNEVRNKRDLYSYYNVATLRGPLLLESTLKFILRLLQITPMHLSQEWILGPTTSFDEEQDNFLEYTVRHTCKKLSTRGFSIATTHSVLHLAEILSSTTLADHELPALKRLKSNMSLLDELNTMAESSRYPGGNHDRIANLRRKIQLFSSGVDVQSNIAQTTEEDLPYPAEGRWEMQGAGALIKEMDVILEQIVDYFLQCLFPLVQQAAMRPNSKA